MFSIGKLNYSFVKINESFYLIISFLSSPVQMKKYIFFFVLSILLTCHVTFGAPNTRVKREENDQAVEEINPVKSEVRNP